MKRKNYIYLMIGIAVFILWLIDLLSFFEWVDIWYTVRSLYLGVGVIILIGCILEAIPETKNKGTRKKCSICGENIMRDEDSVHYHPNRGDTDTEDYCEKCKFKVKV